LPISITEELVRLEAEDREAIAGASDPAALEALRVRFLGRKEGRLTAIMRRLGELSPEERPQVGAEANRVKNVVSELLEERTAQVAAAVTGAARPDVDHTLPARTPWRGARHPDTLAHAEH